MNSRELCGSLSVLLGTGYGTTVFVFSFQPAAMYVRVITHWYQCHITGWCGLEKNLWQCTVYLSITRCFQFTHQFNSEIKKACDDDVSVINLWSGFLMWLRFEKPAVHSFQWAWGQPFCLEPFLLPKVISRSPAVCCVSYRLLLLLRGGGEWGTLRFLCGMFVGMGLFEEGHFHTPPVSYVLCDVFSHVSDVNLWFSGGGLFRTMC